MCQQETIDRLASRHIAKLLDRLGDTVAPVQISEIKRQFRFFADDIKEQVLTKEISDVVQNNVVGCEGENRHPNTKANTDTSGR
jgi:hypothetical protein